MEIFTARGALWVDPLILTLCALFIPIPGSDST